MPVDVDPVHRARGCLYAMLVLVSTLTVVVIAMLLWDRAEALKLINLDPVTGVCLIFAAAGIVALVVAGFAYRALPKYSPSWVCRRCGYHLSGITRPACPECGCPLDPKQIENAPPGLYRFAQDREENPPGKK